MEILLSVVIVAAALAVVLYPVLRREPAPAPADEAALRAEVNRYRAAIRAGTLCRFCGQASPVHSRFCMECGRNLEDWNRGDHQHHRVAG